jgi:hypothetical protein
MPRLERCQGPESQSSRNEALDDVVSETSQNQRREGKQQVYYALSIVIHKKKTLGRVKMKW